MILAMTSLMALDITVPSVQSSGVFSICARDETGSWVLRVWRMQFEDEGERTRIGEMRGWECVPISMNENVSNND